MPWELLLITSVMLITHRTVQVIHSRITWKQNQSTKKTHTHDSCDMNENQQQNPTNFKPQREKKSLSSFSYFARNTESWILSGCAWSSLLLHLIWLLIISRNKCTCSLQSVSQLSSLFVCWWAHVHVYCIHIQFLWRFIRMFFIRL